MFNRKLKPGQKGTKKLMEKYGEKLLNVRYVYNSEKHIMMKTVELLIQQKPWYPNKNKIPYNKIEYGEFQLRRLVKAAGGFWELPYREAVSLGLDNRIINDKNQNK
jgi:hypothetical protein